jgi:hypothetical protein
MFKHLFLQISPKKEITNAQIWWPCGSPHITPSERPDVREKFLPKHSLNFELCELQLRPVGTTHPQFLFFNSLFQSGLQNISQHCPITFGIHGHSLGDCWIDVLTSCTFSAFLMDLRLLSVLPHSSNCLTQERMWHKPDEGKSFLRGAGFLHFVVRNSKELENKTLRKLGPSSVFRWGRHLLCWVLYKELTSITAWSLMRISCVV